MMRVFLSPPANMRIGTRMSHAFASAAHAKHLPPAVVGRANVLIAPDLEAGNLLAKELVLLADGIAAGIVLGGAAPIALTSRSDGAAARVASAALAVLLTTDAVPRA